MKLRLKIIISLSLLGILTCQCSNNKISSPNQFVELASTIQDEANISYFEGNDIVNELVEKTVLYSSQKNDLLKTLKFGLSEVDKIDLITGVFMRLSNEIKLDILKENNENLKKMDNINIYNQVEPYFINYSKLKFPNNKQGVIVVLELSKNHVNAKGKQMLDIYNRTMKNLKDLMNMKDDYKIFSTRKYLPKNADTINIKAVYSGFVSDLISKKEFYFENGKKVHWVNKTFDNTSTIEALLKINQLQKEILFVRIKALEAIRISCIKATKD